MSRYDGLIIPRSYSEYINKTDAATLLQALQLSGVMDAAPTSGSNKPAKSGGIYSAIEAKKPVDTVALNNMNSVTSNAVAKSAEYFPTVSNESDEQIKATNVKLRPRSETLCTIGVLDENSTGISIDFDPGNNQIRVYGIKNGITQLTKYIALN